MIVAIVPAAGQSRRMGRPKLLLQHQGQSILARVVDALRRGGAEPVVVVLPPETEPEGPTLANEALKAGASVIAPPIRPAEMRDSIETGLNALAGKFAVHPDAILIAPADCPGITPELVDRLITRHRESAESIIIPNHQGKRGHPILIPWNTAMKITGLPASAGVNALVANEDQANRVVEIDLADDLAIADVDTPEEWAKWQAQRTTIENEVLHNPRRITVRLFALARQLAGVPEIVVELNEGATVSDLKRAISRKSPALAPLLPNVLIAVDSDYAVDDQIVPHDAQVAVIPPVSGGSDSSEAPRRSAMIEITESEIDHAAITESVRSHQAGAVCTFLGTVRELTGNRRTASLDYEAYPELALKKMKELDDEARRRWPIVESAIVHRIGHLELGEISIVIAVSTPHRRQSFEACQWLIDTFKEVVPIWKRENWADGGQEWVHPGLPTP